MLYIVDNFYLYLQLLVSSFYKVWRVYEMFKALYFTKEKVIIYVTDRQTDFEIYLVKTFQSK